MDSDEKTAGIGDTSLRKTTRVAGLAYLGETGTRCLSQPARRTGISPAISDYIPDCRFQILDWPNPRTWPRLKPWSSRKPAPSPTPTPLRPPTAPRRLDIPSRRPTISATQSERPALTKAS